MREPSTPAGSRWRACAILFVCSVGFFTDTGWIRILTWAYAGRQDMPGIEQGRPQTGIQPPQAGAILFPCSYGYSSLWKTVGWLLPGLLFIPNKFYRPRVAPMRPF
jgi:hypothetical protein